MAVGTMKMSLSSGDVRAYKTRSGLPSFHLATVLLVDSGWNFAVSHVDSLAVTMVLPNRVKIPFEVRMNHDSEFGLDGQTNAITLALSARSRLKRVEWCLVDLIIEGQFDFGGTTPRFRHQQRGTLRTMY